MAKRRAKKRRSPSKSVATRRRKHTRRRRSGGLREGVTGNPVFDAILGAGLVLAATFVVNKIPVDDIKNGTGKGLDMPIVKKGLAAGIGAGISHFLLKSKPAFQGAIATGAALMTVEQFPQLGEGVSVEYVDRNLLGRGQSDVYLDDGNGNTIPLSQDSEGSYGLAGNIDFGYNAQRYTY